MDNNDFANELLNSYNNGIDHAIDIISSHYIPGHVVVNSVLDSIVEKLKILKVKTHTETNTHS